MFPTFFLGGSSEDIYLVGSNTYMGTGIASSPVNVTLPSGSKVGDFALLTFRETSAGYLDTTLAAALITAGWQRLSYRPALDPSSGYTSWERGLGIEFFNALSWFKILESSDSGGVQIGLDNAHPTREFSVALLTFRNVHPHCPIINRRDVAYDGETTGRGLGMPLRFHDRRNKVLVIKSGDDFNVAGDQYDGVGPVPEFEITDEYLASAGPVLNFSLFAPDLDMASYSLMSGEVAGYPVKANWAMTGISSIQNYDESNSSILQWRAIEDSNAGRHYVSYEVELVEGQQYTLYLRAGSGSSSRNIALSVDDGVTERLVINGAWNNLLVNGPDSLTPFDHAVSIPASGSYIAVTPAYNNVCLCMFTADRTGTHEIRIGRATSTTEASLSYTGNGSNGVYVVAVGLTKGWGFPEHYDWDQGPITDYPFSMVGPIFSIFNNSANEAWVNSFELVHKNAPIPAQRINLYTVPRILDTYTTYDSAHDGLTFSVSPELYASSPTYYGYKGFSNISADMRSLVPLYPSAVDPASPDKVYFEYTYVADPTGNLDPANHGIGIGPFGLSTNHDHANGIQTSSGLFSGATNRYIDIYYTKHNGNTAMNYDSSDLRGNLAVGEVVGIAMDRAAGEVYIYVNGVLLATGTMTYPEATFDVGLMYDLGGSMGEVNVNFTGPFSYLPVGYSAWDYRNEVAP